jgi:diaminohydroxyphosphoribosylaminopyrimidine deaminase / 5-amino-6-(5-phosphoribosylamino)uracil reductase
MDGKEEVKFMRRCLDLAAKAEGLTYPNPMVGSVIVCNGRVIGEGYHLRSGEPHAEVIAINSVSDKSKLKNSTLYVNLEPCSHFGKTPPCADFIISHSIPRVIIGTLDSSDKVSGEGFLRLRKAGCDVIAGVCEEECKRLNRRFFTFHEKKRPYITLKWAQSADGFLDIIRSGNRKKEPTWITGKPERALVHKWRASEEAILVGAGTVRADNPKLNVRDWAGSDPLRLVLSRAGVTLAGSSVLEDGGRTILFTYSPTASTGEAERVILDETIPSCIQISDYLFSSGIQSLFIEGGAEVLNHFISYGLWDEARIFTGDKWFGKGVPAPVLSGTLFSKTVFSSSLLEIYLNDVIQKTLGG